MYSRTDDNITGNALTAQTVIWDKILMSPLYYRSCVEAPIVRRRGLKALLFSLFFYTYIYMNVHLRVYIYVYNVRKMDVRVCICVSVHIFFLTQIRSSFFFFFTVRIRGAHDCVLSRSAVDILVSSSP